MTDVAPAPAPETLPAPPYARETFDALAALRGGAEGVTSLKVAFGELTLYAERDSIVALMRRLKSEFQFQQLIELTAVDYPMRPNRFDVVYHLLSVTRNLRLRVTVQTDEATPVPSITPAYVSADWSEREVFDMYGVLFSGHPDLRRLLTDYGFTGHPLRKDFPMTGYTEVRWDEEQRRVVSQPVQLQQEFREFDFLSPWEGSPNERPGEGYPYVLPGDEKAKG